MKYLVSIIINTRDNVEKLNSTINSYFDKADPLLNNFEIVIKADFDDINTLNYISTINNDYIRFIISSRKQGYSSLHEHVDDMIDLAKGQYILSLGDDCLMLTPNWNSILVDYLTQFKVYFLNYQELYHDGSIINLKDKPTNMRNFDANPWSSVGVHPCDFIFPIFPKDLKNIWGTISPHALVDNWIGDIIKQASYNHKLDLHRFIENIQIQLEISPKENSPEVFQSYLAYMNSDFAFKCIDSLNIYLHGAKN
jgi:hypothetical protein